MDRRTFLGTLVSGLAAAPFTVEAQPARISFFPLGSPSSTYDQSLAEAFRLGLRDAGLVEHRHIVVDVIWIGSEPDTHQAVADAIERGTRLLVPCGSSAATAAIRRTKKVPILFVSVGNPVGIGLVKSLSHPGLNATGFSDMLAELGGKYVELATELGKSPVPVHYLWHTLWPDGRYRLEVTERAARSLGVKLRSRGIGDVDELPYVMAAMKEEGADVIVVQPSPFTFRQRHRVIESAAKRGLGTIYPFPAAAEDGAMVAFGPDYVHMYRRVGSYVDRLLKGANPADLPVQQPTKFDLIVNLRVAKTLGFTVPPAVLTRADQVIE
jgi:putative ABC transport system substrate-binding protein